MTFVDDAVPHGPDTFHRVSGPSFTQDDLNDAVRRELESLRALLDEPYQWPQTRGALLERESRMHVEIIYRRLAALAAGGNDKPGATSRPGSEAQRPGRANEPGDVRGTQADKGGETGTRRDGSNEGPGLLSSLPTASSPALSDADVLELLFSEPPGPHSQFVEAEVGGRSVRCGAWVERDGYWRLRITRQSLDAALRASAATGVEAKHMNQELLTLNRLDQNGNPTGGRVMGVGVSIEWQDGPLGRGTERAQPNGAFVEDVLEAACQRLQFYQEASGRRFACRENACAITHIEEALHWLEARTKAREARKVEGTYAP